MKIKAAKYSTRKGDTFAVAQVERSVIENREVAMHIIQHLLPIFPEMHIVLWHWTPGEEPLFFGRPDIAKRLAGTAMASIAWEEHEIPDIE